MLTLPRQCAQHFHDQLKHALCRSWSCGAAMLTTCYFCQGEQFLQFIVAGGGLTYTQCQKNLHGVGMPIVFSEKEIRSSAINEENHGSCLFGP